MRAHAGLALALLVFACGGLVESVPDAAAIDAGSLDATSNAETAALDAAVPEASSDVVQPIQACTALADFVTFAKPVLQGQCSGCHNGSNAKAAAAFDLSKIATNDAAACAQARLKINFVDRAASPLLLAPLWNSNLDHAIKPWSTTKSDAYKAVLAWVVQE